MSEFKGTKGEWYYDKKSKGIKNNKVKGLLATAWSVYNAAETEIRIDNESWIDMRIRTSFIMQQKELEKEHNAKLISCAPEMLKMLKDILSGMRNENYEVCHTEIEKLIQKATTL